METETEAQVLEFHPLRGYTADALIQAVIQLTHCVHDESDTAKADDYRARREFAVAELKRRADR